MRYLVVLLLLLSSTCLADIRTYPHKVFTTHLICGGGVDCPRAEAAFYRARAYYLTLDIELKLVGIHEIPEEMTGDALMQLIKWSVVATKFPKVDMTLVALTAFSPLSDTFDVDSEMVLGMASGIGVLGKDPCGAFSRVVGSPKLASKVMIHEIAHLLGATHMPAGLMYPSMSVGQYSEELARESLQQIGQYLSSLPQ